MIRKYTTYLTLYLFAILLATAIAACSSEVSNDCDSDSTLAAVGEPVTFSMTFTNELTRSGTTIDNVWPANKTVTIANNANPVVMHDFTTGSTVTTNADGNTMLTPVSDNFIWPINNPSWSFSGWYPAAASAPSGITVAADQTIYDATNNPDGIADAVYQGYDLLYCPPTPVTFRQKPVTLTFLHQLARVVVIIGSGYTDTKETVTKVEFGGDKVALKGTISALGTTLNTNGTTTWTVSDEAAYKDKTITMRPNADMTDASNNVYAFECMLPPQTYKVGETVTSIDNLIKITSTKKAPEAGTIRNYHYGNTLDLKAGYQYTYNLLISEQGVVTLATVKVTDWTAGTPINNDAVIPSNDYPTNPIQ